MSLRQVLAIFAFFGVAIFGNPINLTTHNNDTSHEDFFLDTDDWLADTTTDNTVDTIGLPANNMTTTTDHITLILDELEQKLSAATEPSSTDTKQVDLTKRIQFIDSRLRHIEKIVSYQRRLSPDEVKKMVIHDADFDNFPSFPAFGNETKTEK